MRRRSPTTPSHAPAASSGPTRSPRSRRSRRTWRRSSAIRDRSSSGIKCIPKSKIYPSVSASTGASARRPRSSTTQGWLWRVPRSDKDSQEQLRPIDLRRFVRQTRAILVCEQAQRYIPISDCDARERLRAAMARSHHHATALLAIALLVGAQSSRPATAFELSMPIECDVGTSCVIQNYVDHDPSAGYRDFRCGSLTYDGHGGTDFRLLDMASQRRGVNVLAASKGK